MSLYLKMCLNQTLSQRTLKMGKSDKPTKNSGEMLSVPFQASLVNPSVSRGSGLNLRMG
jgi:hypothetical protein